MTESMIERVAEAMKAAAKDNWDIGHQTDETWRQLARAAIEAMREPTEAMIDAACSCERGATVGEALRAEYKAMIDAALSESK